MRTIGTQRKKIQQLIILGILAIGLLIGLLLVRQQQELRKRAVGSNEVDITLVPGSGEQIRSQSFTVKVHLHKNETRPITISGAQAVLAVPSQFTVTSASCLSPFDVTAYVTQGAQSVTLLCAINVAGPTPTPMSTDLDFASVTFQVKADATLGNAPVTFTSTRVTESGIPGQAPDVSTSGENASYTITSEVLGSYSCIFVRKWGAFGSGNGEFQNTAGIAELNGKLYVADIYNNRIQVFTKDGVYQSQFGTSGNGDGQFSHPIDIVASSGKLYIVDKDNHRIQVFNENGQYFSQFGSQGTADGQFQFPNSVESYNGKIYIGDSENNRIQVFDGNGAFLFKWGSLGTGDGQFKVSAVGDIDANGIVYVVDRDNQRIQYFHSDGSSIGKFGTPGSGDGQFNSPQGVTISDDGHIFVSDYYNNRVHIYDENKTFLSAFGTTGTADGRFDSPTKLSFSSPDSLYVSDAGNDRVQQFQCGLILEPTATPSPTSGVVPTATPTPTITPTLIPPTITPTPILPSITLSPTPPSGNERYNYDIGQKTALAINIGGGGGENVPMVRFQARLARIQNHPDIYMKLRAINEESVLGGATYSCNDIGSAGKDYIIPMHADGNGIYSPSENVSIPVPNAISITDDGWVKLTGLIPGNHYTLYLKGPKTRAVREEKNIPLQIGRGEGEQDFDWTADEAALEAGDLPNPNTGNSQDCTVNVIDLSLIEANQASTNQTSLDIADVNYDGIVSGQDIAIVVNTLSTRADDDE